MENLTLARDLVLLSLVALGGGFLAKKAKLPLLAGFILGGVLVRIFFGSWLKFGPEMATFAEIGVALLLFTLGIELTFSRLRQVWEIAVLGGVFQIILTILLGILIFPFLGFDFFSSLFLGAVFSLSSTAIVVRILIEKGQIDTLSGEILVGWLLVQDLAVLPMMIILPKIANPSQDSWLAVLGAILKAGVLLWLVLFLGKRIIAQILEKVATTASRELLLFSVVSLCLLAAFGTMALGLPFALGAFLAGLLVAETSQNHAVFAEVRPLRDIFSMVFFVSLGLLVEPQIFVFWGGKILILGAMVLFFKFFLVLTILFNFGYHAKTAFLVAGGLAGVGEFAYVLTQLGKTQGIIDLTFYSLILGVTLVTMLLTPFVFNFTPAFYQTLKNFSRKNFPPIYERFFALPDRYLREKESLRNHVVICGHGRVGKHVREVLELAQIPYIVVDFNQAVIRDLQGHGVRVIWGDPADFEVLEVAQTAHARALVIALPDRHSQELIIQNSLSLNPKIAIICRSHFEEDKKRLKALGAKIVIQPEFEASLSISQALLVLFKEEPFKNSEDLAKI